MAHKLAIAGPILILIAVATRNFIAPFAEFIVEGGMPTHIAFGITTMFFGLIGIAAALKPPWWRKQKSPTDW